MPAMRYCQTRMWTMRPESVRVVRLGKKFEPMWRIPEIGQFGLIAL